MQTRSALGSPGARSGVGAEQLQNTSMMQIRRFTGQIRRLALLSHPLLPLLRPNQSLYRVPTQLHRPMRKRSCRGKTCSGQANLTASCVTRGSWRPITAKPNAIMEFSSSPSVFYLRVPTQLHQQTLERGRSGEIHSGQAILTKSSVMWGSRRTTKEKTHATKARWSPLSVRVKPQNKGNR